MKNLKISEMLPSLFLGAWSGMVLSVFLSRSEKWVVVGCLVGAAIQVYQDFVYKKRNETKHDDFSK
jgi:uncharacterized membrane protein YoaK (UPF0700 family)